jgi:cysteinyl-tRNA synthetase
MALKVYNTLTRSKELFESITPGYVGIYVCGPTVYGDSHLGHAKSYICFDVIVRYLRSLGNRVRYVQNVTDVGHMTDNDEDAGDDKIAKQAATQRIEPMEVVTRYTMSYFDDMKALNVEYPDIICQASGHIPEQIELVEKLIERGLAYESNGSVYFSVEKFQGYGKLSGRNPEEMMEGARVDVNTEKRNPIDFALWKRAEPEHIMRWKSPWGEGFPGWHVECSAMSMKYLGESFDIHGGGIENQFPHHECEIAQSEGVTGKPFVKYWLHNNMLTINGTKMGKSLGNFITIKDMIQRIPAPALRMFVLMSHYRSVTDFSDEALAAAEKGMNRMTAALQSLGQRLADAPDGDADSSAKAEIEAVRTKFAEAMDDDFNTAGAIGELFNLVRVMNSLATANATKGSLELARRTLLELGGDILGLWFDDQQAAADSGNDMDGVMELVLSLRQTLRAEKNYALADQIREKLTEIGILIKDEKERTTWTRT